MNQSVFDDQKIKTLDFQIQKFELKKKLHINFQKTILRSKNDPNVRYR